MSSTQHLDQTTTLRIGDADRDRAVQALSEHLASGRLDQSEFDERMAAALGARTASDLEPLFLDLPEPRPVTGTRSPAASTRPTHPSFTSPTGSPDAAQVEGLKPAGGPGGGCGGQRKLPYMLAPLVWPAAIALVVISGGHLWWMMIVAALVCSGLWGGGHRRRMQARSSHRRLDRQQERTDPYGHRFRPPR